MRTANLDDLAGDAPSAPSSLAEAIEQLSNRFADPEGPAADSAAAAAGALAAGLLAWLAARSTAIGPRAFRARAGDLAGQADTLQQDLSRAAAADAALVRAWLDSRRGTASSAPPDAAAAIDSVLEIARLCARAASLAAEIAERGPRGLRAAIGALLLAPSGVDSALLLAETNLAGAADPHDDDVRQARRRSCRLRLVLQRARAVLLQAD